MNIHHHHTIQIGCSGCPFCHARRDEAERTASEMSPASSSLLGALDALARLVATLSQLDLTEGDTDHDAVRAASEPVASPKTASAFATSRTEPTSDALDETLRTLFTQAIKRIEHSAELPANGAAARGEIQLSPIEAAFLAAFSSDLTLA